MITLGTPSFSHIEIDMRDIRSALDDLLGVLAPGHSLVLRSTVAPGTTEFVAGYLAKHRGFRDRRGGVRRARPRAHRRGALPGGDRHAALHHRRRRRPARARSPAELFGGLRRADRADHAGAGGAREDLGQHPALHQLRAAQPADDGLRALRRERVRGDRPRSTATTPAAGSPSRGSPRGPACARTSPSPRSAPTRPGCCSRSRA